MKCKRREEFIARIEGFDELDEEAIEKIKMITSSTSKHDKNEIFKNMDDLVDDIINDCFDEIEELFMPYIKEHKKVHNSINTSLINLQEKNLKKITNEEDVLEAKSKYLESVEYLKNRLPKNLKELNRIKHTCSIKRINDMVKIPSVSKSMKVKVLAWNNKLYKSIMEIYSILEEELDSIFIEELNNFFILEIEIANRLQNKNTNVEIESIYEEIVFESYSKIDSMYKIPKTYTELIKLAEKEGFNFCRQCKTSHAIYKNKNNKIVVIPNKGNIVAPMGTQIQILKRIFYK